MRKKIILILVSLLIIAGVIAAYLSVNMTNITAIYIEPDRIVRSVGQEFTINISISNVASLYAWECKLQWNTTILDLVDITEGPFLRKHGTTFFNYKSNETTSNTIVDCTLLGDVAGADGNGVLVSIQLHVISEGSCDLALYEVKIIDSSEKMMDHTANGGHFSTNS